VMFDQSTLEKAVESALKAETSALIDLRQMLPEDYEKQQTMLAN